MASVTKRKWSHKGVEREAWVLRYLDGKGVRRSRTFEKKKDADRERLKVASELVSGKHISHGNQATISAVISEYLEQAAARMKDGRIGRSRYISLESGFRLHILPTLGKVIISELTQAHVDGLYRDMVGKRGLSVRTAKDRIYNLQLLESHAIKHRLMFERPVSAALRDLRGTTSSRVTTFLATEISTLLSAATGKTHNMKERSSRMMECAVHLAAFCGLRFGEIMALQLSTGRTEAGIDLEAGLIRVRHSLTFDDTLKAPKTRAGNRDVPLPRHLNALITAWIKTHAAVDSRGLIFRTPKRTAITGANFHLQWHKLLRNAGLLRTGDKFHFHALRHFCASWMIENGLPVTDVAVLLGHSKFDVTLQTYAHPVVAASARHSAIEAMVANLPIDAPVTQRLITA